MQSAQLSTARVLRSKKNFVGIFVFWEMVCYTIFNMGRVGCCSGLQVLDGVLKQADTAMYEQKKLHKRPRSEGGGEAGTPLPRCSFGRRGY